MQVNGTIHLKVETETFGSNGFRKILLVVATEEQYVQYLPIEFVQDKSLLLDNFNVGQSVKVSINLRGNEHNGKYYPSIQGWRIESSQQANQAATQAAANIPVHEAEEVNENDDLPF